MAASLNESPVKPSTDALRAAVREHSLWPEDQAVNRLLRCLELTGGARHRAVALGVKLVEGARARREERPFLDAFLQEFGLSNQEGIALMCIAEALLRIPDDATADRLIAEQLASGDWSAHAGKSESVFVNASTWGLMLTGGILELDPTIARTGDELWVDARTLDLRRALVRDHLYFDFGIRSIDDEFDVRFRPGPANLPVIATIHGQTDDGDYETDYTFEDVAFPASLPDWYFTPKQYGMHRSDAPA